jgi:hypothetical protein
MPAPATCGTVDPCGGDPTGTWQVLGGCLPTGGTAAGSCTQVQLLTLSFAGTLTFNSDMTYVATDFTETIAEVDTTPVSCWGYQGKTCADEDKLLSSQMSKSGTGFLSYASCTGSTTCACTLADTAAPVIGGSGTYSLQGDLINFTTASTSYQGFSYCVQGGLFHLTSAATTVYDDGTEATTIGEDIVAQMQ